MRLAAAGGLRAAGSLADGGRSPLVVAALAAAGLLLVPVLLLALRPDSAPDRIEAARLAGPRTPNCVRLVVLPDVSGSMASATAVRQAALDRFIRWAPTNLRPDDELAVVAWDDRAVVQLPPTPVARLRSARVRTAATGGTGGTALPPVLRVVAGLPASGCSTHLAFITDGAVGRTAAGGIRGLLGAAHVDDVATILPTSDAAPAVWDAAFPAVRVQHADPDDPQQTALAVSRVVAAATGQRLVRR